MRDPSRPAPLAAYVSWIVERALPRWADAGFDHAAGRFRERLDWTGAPLAVPHRAMVQARQIYAFSHAAMLGWSDEGGRLAARALANLRRDFLDEGAETASFAFSIHPGGGIAAAERDAYAHAFVLFALAWQYRLTGDPALLALADKVLAFVDRELADPAGGGLFDAHPVVDRAKRQNPHMHLLEALLFLAEAAPARDYLARAADLVALFRQRFFRADPGVLLEHFSEDWSAHPAPARAGLWEPGHHFEWVWLLDRYAGLAGEDMSRWTEPLFATAFAHGLSNDGLILDELDLALQPVTRAHRVWPHTEAIKAAVVRHRAGDAAALPFAERMAERLLATFLDRPFAGGWIDHVDAGGRPKVDYVPASSLYHLLLAATEAATILPAAPAANA